MKVETSYQTVTITDIPNVVNLTSMEVNLQDGLVNLTYKGWVPPNYGTILPEAISVDADVQRYDGELDPPGMKRPAP